MSNEHFRDFMDYRSSMLSRVQEPSALEIAAEQMRLWPSIDPAKQLVSFSPFPIVAPIRLLSPTNQIRNLSTPKNQRCTAKPFTMQIVWCRYSFRPTLIVAEKFRKSITI